MPRYVKHSSDHRGDRHRMVIYPKISPQFKDGDKYRVLISPQISQISPYILPDHQG